MPASVSALDGRTFDFEIEPPLRWEWILLALGVVLRLLLQLPLHRYPGDADCVLTALQGVQVLHGDPAVFVPSGYRLGALNAYVTAAAYVIFGVGRAGLAAGVFAVGTLQMLLWWLATRELVGSRLARIALPFIVLPSPAVLEWGLHLPNANPEIFLAATAVLWLGARLHRRGGGMAAYVLFGLAIGVAFWASLLTLAVSVPTALWVARRRDRPVFWRRFAATAAGALAGASPWLAFNLRYGWQSLTESAATEPVNNWVMLRQSLRNLWSDRMVHLFTGADGLGSHAAPPLPRWFLWLGALALVLYVLAAAAGVFLSRRRDGDSGASRPVLALAFAVFGLLIVMNLVSRMAVVQGNSVRYILPAALFFPPLFALAWVRTGERSRRVITVFAAATLLLHASAPSWPWSSSSARYRRELAENRRLAGELVARGVDAVYGSYWLVYPLIFDSDRALIGVPIDPHADFFRERTRALPSPARWAIAEWRPRLQAISRHFGMSPITAGPFGAVVLEEGAGPAGHADSPKLGEWASAFEPAERR